jgi:hypothetical protein
METNSNNSEPQKNNERDAHAAENKQEAISSVEKAYEILLEDSNIQILISGTGNILNKQNAPTKGQISVWYNKATKNLVQLNDSEVDQCLDYRMPTMRSQYQLRRDRIRTGEVLIVDVEVRGRTGSTFLEDNRKGSHLTCAINFTDETQLRNILGESLANDIFSSDQLLTQKTGELLVMFLKRLVPDYCKSLIG